MVSVETLVGGGFSLNERWCSGLPNRSEGAVRVEQSGELRCLMITCSCCSSVSLPIGRVSLSALDLELEAPRLDLTGERVVAPG